MSTDLNLDDGPLVIHFDPGTLADLAATSFAASLLRSKIIRIRENRQRELNEYSTIYLDPADASIPIGLRDTIDRFITDTNLSWVEWWYHHQENVFFEQVPLDEMICFIEELVWSPDGTINYEKSAKKMLDGDKITNVQKLQLACAYCFFDDGTRLQQALQEKEIEKATKGSKSFDGTFLQHLHRRYGFHPRADFHEKLSIVIERIESSTRGVHQYRIRLKPYDEWSVIDFFFHFFHDDKKLGLVDDIINLGVPRLTLNILTKLTGNELISIFNKRFYQIISTLVKTRFYYKHTIMIWKRFVPIIDDNSLANVMRYLKGENFEQNYLNSIKWEMWLVLSERQKQVIIDEKIIYYFFESYLDINYNSYHTPNFPLIIDIFLRCNPKIRYKYWSAHWRCLVVGQLDHRNDIERIMKLCLDNDQQIENFKKEAMLDCKSIAKYCNDLLLYGRVREIQTYLEFCISNPQVIHNCKKEIITKMLKQNVFTFLFKWRNHGKMADFEQLFDVFTENEYKDYLNGVVVDCGNWKSTLGLLNTSRDLQKIIGLVDEFVSSENDRAKVKLDFFELYDSNAISDRSVRLELMAWCFNIDRPLVDNFKTLSSRKRRAEDSKSRIFDLFVAPYYKKPKFSA